MIKPFEVRQDRYGNWGIVDLRECRRDHWGDESFAAWENWGGITDMRDSFWSEVLEWAIKLNAGISNADDLAWTYYEPKEHN